MKLKLDLQIRHEMFQLIMLAHATVMCRNLTTIRHPGIAGNSTAPHGANNRGEVLNAAEEACKIAAGVYERSPSSADLFNFTSTLPEVDTRVIAQLLRKHLPSWSNHSINNSGGGNNTEGSESFEASHNHNLSGNSENSGGNGKHNSATKNSDATISSSSGSGSSSSGGKNGGNEGSGGGSAGSESRSVKEGGRRLAAAGAGVSVPKYANQQLTKLYGLPECYLRQLLNMLSAKRNLLLLQLVLAVRYTYEQAVAVPDEREGERDDEEYLEDLFQSAASDQAAVGKIEKFSVRAGLAERLLERSLTRFTLSRFALDRPFGITLITLIALKTLIIITYLSLSI